MAERRRCRSQDEAVIPKVLRAQRLGAKLERNAAENQAAKHRYHRKIDGRKQRGVCDGKYCVEAGAAEHQPGLVAVPDRSDRVQHDLSLAIEIKERKQKANAEIEAIQQQVEEHAEADDACPYSWKIDHHRCLTRRSDRWRATSVGGRSATRSCRRRPVRRPPGRRHPVPSPSVSTCSRCPYRRREN